MYELQTADVDCSAAYLMNQDKNKITHLGVAEQFGLCRSDFNKIRCNRDISKERISNFKPYKMT